MLRKRVEKLILKFPCVTALGSTFIQRTEVIELVMGKEVCYKSMVHDWGSAL